MSDDQVLDLDLSGWDGLVPDSWRASLRGTEENDEMTDDVPLDDGGGTAVPSGFGKLTTAQREEWAESPDLLRGERQQRRIAYSAWLAAHPDADPEAEQRRAHQAAIAETSGWSDVALGSLLDDLEAGTLALPVPTVGWLDDGSAGLFYPGRVNGLAGESGGGKSWIALKVGLEQMRLGQHFYYLDWEDSPTLALLRLVGVLGADPALLRSAFHYLHPSKHDDQGIAALVERVAATPGALVVLDSTGESIASAGLNQNHDEEVAEWFAALADPLAEQGGACVVLLDHMAKSEDGGLWPIGSQRKRAAITGAQYIAEVAKAFSRTADGLVTLKVAKDRHGARQARSIASYVHFTHPIESVSTDAEGTTTVVTAEALAVAFGPGKTAEQVQADREAKAATRAAAKLDDDVRQLGELDPEPSSHRDVMKRMRWGADRAASVLREWRARSDGSS